MAQVGRISGPLLTANLERNGIDLAFRNTLDTTQLLYLNVVNGKIGVNTDTTPRELTVNSTTQTTDLISNEDITIANFNIENNNINVAVGNVFLNANQAIKLSNLETDNIRVSDNSISSYRSNSDIDIETNGTGATAVKSNLNVLGGNLYTPSNITLEGNIFLGDEILQDTVVFNADVTSNITPTSSLSYNLGSPTNQWGEIFSYLLNGEDISTSELAIGGNDLSLRQGNIFYVSQNGDDSNVGDHPQGPFRTIKRALQAADASTQGPVTIYVYPGGYEEETPLVVPSNVTITGADIRNTIVRPESAYQSEDVFHLNGETTIQNLTIKDFYYDSLNDTGYAFRFAPNTVVSTRSPYIQNITVITQGTTTSVDDPRGFASGDAGKGALVDGASVDSASEEASMLFHSVTFITPGVDGLTMTNGVRVEWLNSFTYFANRGLYAVDGVTGHLSTDGSTVKYGAEIRSIGSANVYGNYGAVADGADCLMYLIQHNFAYIGVGKYVDNDPSRVIQSQEVTELNSGIIYFQSIDHLGNFRVGNQFVINQETGETSFDVESVSSNVISELQISDGINTTLIGPSSISLGNLRLRDNVLESLDGSIIFDPNTVINLNSNVNISNNLDITGNLTFDGSINIIGNETTDTVKLNVDIDQTLLPSINGEHNLGSESKIWTNVWLSEANFANINIKDTYITTDVSNADLDLRADGFGKIYLPNNNFTITNDLTVNGTSNFKTTNVTGNLSHTGGVSLTGDLSVTNLTISQDLDVSSQAQFEEILFDGNVITTTSTNADLELRANGTGEILVPNNNVVVSQDLSTAIINTSNINVATDVALNEIQITDSIIEIDDNFVTTTVSNADLELRAATNGVVYLPNNDLTITNNLTVNADTSTQEINVTGNITQTGDYQISVPDALGPLKGFIYNRLAPSSFFRETRQIGGYTGNPQFGGQPIFVYRIDIVYEGQTILNGVQYDYTTDSWSFYPSSYLDYNKGNIVNADSNTSVRYYEIEKENDRYPSIPQPASYAVTGNLTISQDLDVSSQALFEEILFDGNVITTTSTNADLELRANSTGDILIPNNNVQINNNLITGTLNSSNVSISNTIALETIELSTDIQIFDNVITTTNSNSNLELRANGTGDKFLQNIKVNDNTINTDSSTITFSVSGNLNIDATGAVRLPKGTTGQRSNTQGDLRFNTTDNVFEGHGSATVTFNGVYSADRQTSVLAHPTNDTLQFRANSLSAGYIDSTSVFLNGLQVDDIFINNRTISTNVSNSNLELRTSGAELVLDNVTLIDNQIKNNYNDGLVFESTGNGYVKVVGTHGVVIPSGTTEERPASRTAIIGETRWNTSLSIAEVYDGIDWISSAGTLEVISEEDYNNLLLEYTLIFG